MTGARARLLRLLLIASTCVSALLIVVFGVPQLRAYFTPRLQRAWVVSAELGDAVASSMPRETLAGTPVTLYAVVQAKPWAGEPRFYGTVSSVQIEPPGLSAPSAQPVLPWPSWAYQPEYLWFKVEPEVPFDNPDFDIDFSVADIRYRDTYTVSWGFDAGHAADVSPTGDAYPDWDVGTMRFMTRAVIRNRSGAILDRVTSPGADAVHAAALGDRPHLVSVRGGDDVFGRMQAFAGLPYVPILQKLPAAQHPASLFRGGTVLDFWIAALRAGGQDVDFTSWEELPTVAETVVADMFLARDGNYYFANDPLRAVTFDVVRPGDLLAIEDHVGVLYEDRGPGGAGDGILNRWDRLLGAYFEPLRDIALGDAFEADVTVYRLGD